jgi:hypothetical protein
VLHTSTLQKGADEGGALLRAGQGDGYPALKAAQQGRITVLRTGLGD